MSHPGTWLAGAVESAMNGYLALDPEVRTRLRSLDGKVICIALKGFDLRLYFVAAEERIEVLSHYEGEPDTLLVGSPTDLLRLVALQAEEKLFDTGVEFHGDTELGEKFREILIGAEIDWEELLSHVTGDPLAHQLGNLARGVADTIAKGAATLRQDVSEYLREESSLLPTAIEVDNLLEDVDRLRLDTDRLEARIQRLEAALRKDKV
jgi:ubiquinone biosynthesis protein UbiJ